MDRNPVHPRVSFCISTLVGFLVFGQCAFALDPAQKASLDAFVARIQRESGTPGVSAAVAIDGKIVYQGAAGHADVQNAVPQSSRTVHNIGSISKIIAAVAIMQLVEQGTVDLDASIRDYVPYYPEKFSVGGREQSLEPYRITLRHVLTHTSGTRHYREGEFGVYGHLGKVQYARFEDAIESWKHDPLLFAPGEHWSYSSHASNLMHGVVETVTGMKFEDYLNRHVWSPAGMLATQFDVPSRIIAKRGRGYARDGRGKLIHANDENVSYKYAGGGILSTVEDLCRFAVAINEGRLLNQDTVQLMWTNQFPAGVEAWSRRQEEDPDKRAIDFNQCLVWREHIDSAGNISYSHTGSVRGTLTHLINYPSIRLVVAVHGNSRDFPRDDALRGIARVFLPPSFTPPAITGEYPRD